MARRLERSGKADIPGWLMKQILDALDRTKLDYDEIATRAAANVGRRSGWDRSVVSNFKTGRSRTWEMANGLCDVFGLPRAVYRARSLAEAFRLQAVAKEFDEQLPANPDRRARLAVVDQAASYEHAATIDQTHPVISKDERTDRSRRPRRAARGRS